MNESASMKILLADDDRDDCFIFNEALKELSLGTQFTAVHDGEQLMHYLMNETDDLATVIYLDLNMPRKNGFTCLEEIKRSEKLKSIPVIIYSTSYDEYIANLVYKNGAHYFICKPASFSDLKKVIARSLQLISEGQASQPPRDKFVLSDLRSIWL